MGISGVPIYPLSQGLLLKGSLLQLGALYKAKRSKKGRQEIEEREADGADYGGVVSRFMDSLANTVDYKIGIEYTSSWLAFSGITLYGDYMTLGIMTLAWGDCNNQTHLFEGLAAKVCMAVRKRIN